MSSGSNTSGPAEKRICLFVSPPYQNNRIFESGETVVNRDDCLRPYRRLQALFAERGFQLGTQDINPPHESAAVLHMEMPKDFSVVEQFADKSFGILFETELIRPDNWKKTRLKKFKKVFSWRQVEGVEMVPLSFPQVPPLGDSQFLPQAGARAFGDRKLCTLIAGGKLSLHPKNLYFERIRYIRWFEKNHPDDFDFYGLGWDRVTLMGPKVVRAFNRVPLWRKFLPAFSSYRGPCKNKYETLSRYKFSICFENAKEIPGYITEKIFDCFFSQNVPVYWGAPDIQQYIPEACYIDARKFSGPEALYEFLQGLSEEQYLRYLGAARQFLNSEAYSRFTEEHFAQTLVREVCLSMGIAP